MIFTFLGTAAANAYPEAFCGCNNCAQARKLGGPSLRKRSSALINDDLLLDLGPDIHASSFIHGRPLTRVQYCLQTHAHADHLDPSHLFSRSPEYGVVGAPLLHFFASPATVRRTAQLLAADCQPGSLLDTETGKRLNLEIHQIEAGQSFVAGDYRVTAFAANHDPSVQPLLYAVERNGRSVFYGVDTAELPEQTWQAFHRHGLKFDLIVLDHTYGPDEPGSDHLCAQEVIAHAARLREEGLLGPDARVFATHIAHEGNPAHPELAAFAAQHGYEVAYDGLVV